MRGSKVQRCDKVDDNKVLLACTDMVQLEVEDGELTERKLKMSSVAKHELNNVLTQDKAEESSFGVNANRTTCQEEKEVLGPTMMALVGVDVACDDGNAKVNVIRSSKKDDCLGMQTGSDSLAHSEVESGAYLSVDQASIDKVSLKSTVNLKSNTGCGKELQGATCDNSKRDSTVHAVSELVKQGSSCGKDLVVAMQQLDNGGSGVVKPAATGSHLAEVVQQKLGNVSKLFGESNMGMQKVGDVIWDGRDLVSNINKMVVSKVENVVENNETGEMGVKAKAQRVCMLSPWAKPFTAGTYFVPTKLNDGQTSKTEIGKLSSMDQVSSLEEYGKDMIPGESDLSDRNYNTEDDGSSTCWEEEEPDCAQDLHIPGYRTLGRKVRLRSDGSPHPNVFKEEKWCTGKGNRFRFRKQSF